MPPLLLAIAMILDALVGDPPAWPHLVRLMGRIISFFDQGLRQRFSSPKALRAGGMILVVVVVGGSALGTWLLLSEAFALWEPLGWALWLCFAFQCLAAGDLWRHARATVLPLSRGDLSLARSRLAMMVGRETDELDQAGIRRGLIETVAENLNDGVIAPLFYLVLGGPVLAVAYKAISTLDSMVGYRNFKYRDLGLIPARLDDAAGWIPARLTAVLLVAAAWLVGPADAKGAWQAMVRDHDQHPSPNAGWPEAACAGALGIRLGGPSRYQGRMKPKPWIGQDYPDPKDHHLGLAMKLMGITVALAGLLGILVLFLAS